MRGCQRSSNRANLRRGRQPARPSRRTLRDRVCRWRRGSRRAPRARARRAPRGGGRPCGRCAPRPVPIARERVRRRETAGSSRTARRRRATGPAIASSGLQPDGEDRGAVHRAAQLAAARCSRCCARALASSGSGSSAHAGEHRRAGDRRGVHDRARAVRRHARSRVRRRQCSRAQRWPHVSHSSAARRRGSTAALRSQIGPDRVGGEVAQNAAVTTSAGTSPSAPPRPAT